MTEEEKKVETPTPEEEQPQEPSGDGQKPEGQEEPSNDKTEREKELEAQLEAERKKNKEQELARERYALKREKLREKEELPEEPENEEDKPLTIGEWKKLQAEQREADMRMANQDKARELAKSMAGSSETLANLIYERWKNRPFESGLSLKEQVEDTFYSIPQVRQALQGQNEELMRALRAKESVNRDATGAYREAKPRPTGVKNEAFFIAQGYVKKNGRLEKKLPNGKILFINKQGQAEFEGQRKDPKPNS